MNFSQTKSCKTYVGPVLPLGAEKALDLSQFQQNKLAFTWVIELNYKACLWPIWNIRGKRLNGFKNYTPNYTICNLIQKFN